MTRIAHSLILTMLLLAVVLLAADVAYAQTATPTPSQTSTPGPSATPTNDPFITDVCYTYDLTQSLEASNGNAINVVTGSWVSGQGIYTSDNGLVFNFSEDFFIRPTHTRLSFLITETPAPSPEIAIVADSFGQEIQNSYNFFGAGTVVIAENNSGSLLTDGDTFDAAIQTNRTAILRTITIYTTEPSPFPRNDCVVLTPEPSATSTPTVDLTTTTTLTATAETGTPTPGTDTPTPGPSPTPDCSTDNTTFNTGFSEPEWSGIDRIANNSCMGASINEFWSTDGSSPFDGEFTYTFATPRTLDAIYVRHTVANDTYMIRVNYLFSGSVIINATQSGFSCYQNANFSTFLDEPVTSVDFLGAWGDSGETFTSNVVKIANITSCAAPDSATATPTATNTATTTPTPQPTNTITRTPLPITPDGTQVTPTPILFISRTPGPTATPFPSVTLAPSKTLPPSPAPTNTRLPSLPPPPTGTFIPFPTEVQNTVTPFSTYPGPELTPIPGGTLDPNVPGTPVVGTLMGTPQVNATNFAVPDDLSNLHPGIRGDLGTAVAYVNDLPRDIGGIAPELGRFSEFTGYARGLMSGVQLQEIFGQTIYPIPQHILYLVTATVFTGGVMMIFRMVVYFIKFATWLTRFILKIIPFIG